MTDKMKEAIIVILQEQSSEIDEEQLEKMCADELKDWMKERAARAGIELTEDDFIMEEELDDDELESLTGGKMVYSDGKWRSDCVCAITGGGSADDRQKACACIGGGFAVDRKGREVMTCFMAGWHVGKYTTD